jgi:hypothetical protein
MAAKGARPHRQNAEANTPIEVLGRDRDGVECGLELPIGPDRDAIRFVRTNVLRAARSADPHLELRDLNDGTVLLRLRQRLPIGTIDVITSKLAAV